MLTVTDHQAGKAHADLRLNSVTRSLGRSLIVLALCFSSAANLASGKSYTLSSPLVKFIIEEESARCQIVDEKAGITWGSSAAANQFGAVTLIERGEPRTIELGRCEVQPRENGLLATFRLIPTQPLTTFRVWIELLPDQRTLQFSYQQDAELQARDVALLDQVLAVHDADQGYVVVPVREGLLIPSDSRLSFAHQFDTYAYEGCHMRMLGLSRLGAAVLLTWDDPYLAVNLRSSFDAHTVPQQTLSPTLVMRKSARSFRFSVLGRGGYVEMAKAYREHAQRQQLVTTWDEKIKGEPRRSLLAGAINYKLWSTLDRSMNEDSTVQQSSRTNWTFEEAAQVAEHLKHDLKLDKVLFGMGGWIRRGYDNQHPDILPTAPECGGDAAFADCAKRVMRLGYLLSLHDNYQDMYRDSPSWNERYLMRNADGKIARGGHWAGGFAYLTCSKMALELAERPQNLAAVKQLSGANAYFIDTTYAAGLQECFDPTHPLTRQDDMKWKQALSDYARSVFGVFGSECGREWAIPHSDFFEGLTGVSGGYYHDANLLKKTGGTVIPLFDLVYRDCIAMYGKYGYDHYQAAPYVLAHLVIGRPLNYHSIPAHLYWKREPEGGQRRDQQDAAAKATADKAVFVRGDGGWTAGLHPLDRFVKNTYEVLSPLNELTARMQMTAHQFLTADRQVQKSVFGQGRQSVTVVVNGGAGDYSCVSPVWGHVVMPPYGFLVDSPTFAAFLASSIGGASYESPTLFTVRSLDGRAIGHSRQVRVYHAFGDPTLPLKGTTRRVDRESILR